MQPTNPRQWKARDMTAVREVWAPIPTAVGYEASNLGRIRSLDRKLRDGRQRKGTVIRPQLNKKNGRLYAALGRIGKLPVAVWVAMAFLGHVPNGLQSVVDHINDDCTDDRLANLQVLTNRENIAKGYARKAKTSGLPTGVSRTQRNKKPYMVSMYLNGKTQFIGTFYTVEEASLAYHEAAMGREKT